MNIVVPSDKSIYEAHRLSHWNILLDAQNYIRLGNVTKALPLYERALRKNFHMLYADQSSNSGWIIQTTPSTPSLNWATVFLIEYFIQRKVWWEWFGIVTPLMNQIEKLSLRSRSRLISGRGLANQNVSSDWSLRKEINSQSTILREIDYHSFESGLHYMVLGKLYRQLRDHQKSMNYLELAAQIIDFDKEPYYAILLDETFSSTYYYLNEFGDNYYDRSAEISRDVERKAGHCNQGVDFTLQAYNLGWIYVEQGQFREALFEFEKGHSATKHLTDYDRALYAYGIGYTYLRQKSYEEAINYLKEALFVFNSQSHLMSAICLGLMAKIFQEKGNYDEAIEKAFDALDKIKRVNNPLQSYHIYRRIFILYRRTSPIKAFFFGIITYLYKLRLRKSLLRV